MPVAPPAAGRITSAQKEGPQRHITESVTGMYKKPTADVTVNVKMWKAFPSR